MANPESYDVIIAGGGPSGLLTAARLAAARPGIRIVILEKEAILGGRLRAAPVAGRAMSYGLNGVSDTLFELWNQTLKLDPDGPDLATLTPMRQSATGVLAGNRINQIAIDQWFTPKGARNLGGFAASRQWPEVEEILRAGATAGTLEDDDDDEDEGALEEGDAVEMKAVADKTHPFSHYWKKQRKSPATIVMEHFGSAYGIPDIWSSTLNALQERSGFHTGRLHCGNWDEAINALLVIPAVAEAVSIRLSSRIARAEKDADGVWTIAAESGDFRAPTLVVAQPPWLAAHWLPRGYWPPHVLQIASKTKPVSAVVISERLLLPQIEIPDVLVVPAEKVQIIRVSEHEVCFQATIDFELSLQAPAVVKAVKQLKRARKKLLILHPGIVSEDDRIALQTVAWAQSPAHADRRVLERLEKKPCSTKSLAFVGDAYGGSYDGDQNIVRSLGRAVEAMTAP